MESFYYYSDLLKGAVIPSMQYLSDMITARPSEEGSGDKKELLCVSFNQDVSALAVGHDEGYTLYSLRSLETLDKVHEGTSPTRTCVIERLFSSSLITLVSMEHTRKLSVYHYQKDNEICCHGYSSAILAVRLNRMRVVVCLEENIHVHNIRDMRLLHMIKDTPPNPLGLCDLSASDTACYLAYPGSASTGHVQIFDADSLTAICGFAAHDGALAALKFNPDGTKLATASQKGTVIRVFEIPSAQRLFEFTRGMKRCVTIYSLGFSADSTLLCSSSNTETLHVFSLQRPENPPDAQKVDDSQDSVSSWVNYFSQQATAYLPTHMNELMLRAKSICTARLPMNGTKTVVGIPKIGNTNYLVAASADGYLFCFTIPTEGSECSLLRQFRIGPSYGEEQAGSIVPLGSTSISVGSARVGAGQLYPDLFEEPAQRSPSRDADQDDSSASSEPSKRHSPAYQPTSGTSSKHSTPPSSSNAPVPTTTSTSSSSDRQRRSPHSVPPFAALTSGTSPGTSSSSGSANSKDKQLPINRESDNSSSDSEVGGLGSPTDLNDLGEFPPLNQDLFG